MSKQLSKREAVEQLNALDSGDGEEMHAEADKILLAYVPEQVRQAYERVQDRANFWACA